MNAKTLIATALVLSFAGAGAAFAQEGTQDFPAPKYQAPAKLTRSEVIATLKAAPAAEATANEASPAPQAVSTLSRAQVQAEAREAHEKATAREAAARTAQANPGEGA